MLHKTTTKLFSGKYQHKIVLVCAGASVFRSGDMDATIAKLDKVDVIANRMDHYRTTKIGTKEDLAYAYQLAGTIKRLGNDCNIRVESPWISIYTNNELVIDTLVKLDESRVKYISSPLVGTTLTVGTIIMSKRNFDYKITLGRTRSENSAFVQWAESQTGKMHLTKSCKRQLLQNSTWGGSHFYITGDNVLLMAKMHLGGAISKIERITRQ